MSHARLSQGVGPHRTIPDAESPTEEAASQRYPGLLMLRNLEVEEGARRVFGWPELNSVPQLIPWRASGEEDGVDDEQKESTESSARLACSLL